MGDSGYLGVDRPRPARVIFGGTVACVGLLVGTLAAMPRYHLARTTKAVPEVMNWDQLVQRGPFDNGHVQVVDVALELSPQTLDLITDDSEGRWENEPFSELGPVKVVPRGSAPGQVPSRVVVPHLPHPLRAAHAEIEASGTLTGRFQPVGAGRFDSILGPLAGLPIQESVLTSDVRYVYVPPDALPDPKWALGWFVGSIAAVSMGLVLAGSGRPTWWAWLVFSLPSVLSLCGSPLRQRNSGSWQVVYAAAGIGMIFFGIRQISVVGHWWLVDADPVAMAVGFLVLSLGIAAICGALTSAMASRFGHLLGRRRGSGRESGGVGPVNPKEVFQRGPRYSRRYIDPKFTVVTEVDLNATTQRLTEGFEQIDFEPPLVIEAIDDDRVIPTTIQVGCQDLAMAIVETIDETTRPRLVSILDDGFAIITLAPAGGGESHEGEAGTIEVCTGDDPLLMLSSHLERLAIVAEQRGVSPLTQQSDEWRDVYLLAGRVLADIRYRHGDSNRYVDEAVHGRFQFPPTPQHPLASCSE